MLFYVIEIDDDICIDIYISLDEYRGVDLGIEVVLHGDCGLILRKLVLMWTSMLVCNREA